MSGPFQFKSLIATVDCAKKNLAVLKAHIPEVDQ
jgi:hypothetical protein